MKTLNPILAILLILFLFGCEDFSSPHQTFSDAVQQIPDVQIIPGAENAAITVQNDRVYSYFRVTINNVERNRKIANGTYYAWCLQMNVPINTGEEYTGVKLYSTEGDRWLNRISYIVNNRPAYERANPGLSWREIQVAIWVMLETQGYQLPADFATSYDYNAQYVSNILNDVQQNGIDFKPKAGDITIVITNAEQNEQTIGIERQTAWMLGGDGFIEFGPGWGGYYLWNTGDEQTFVRPLVAGQHHTVGQVTFEYFADRIEVNVEVFGDNDWVLDDTVHVYIGEGIPGNAPGLYPFGAEFGEDQSLTKTYSETIDIPSGTDRRGNSYDFSGLTEFYIALHTVVVEGEEIFVCGTSTITDRDGNIYQTVKIGDQCWMAENLRTTRYSDGMLIPTNLSDFEWANTTSGAYAIFPHLEIDGINSDEEMVKAYGVFYNWYTVVDSRGLCPTGWHVPGDNEWKQLEMYLGMSQEEADGIFWRGYDNNIGGKLKSIRTEPLTHPRWNTPNNGANNESGFSGLPAGYRHYTGSFYNWSLGSGGLWWSSTEVTDNEAWPRHLNYLLMEISRYGNDKRNGFSVRCVME